MIAALLLLGLLVGGCASAAKEGPPVTGVEPWRWENVEGHIVQTPHYRIYTTVEDPQVFDRFARVMEAAHRAYSALIPPLPRAPEEPISALRVYLFDDPAAQYAFTRHLTGADAEIYLSVGSGGYTYGDVFVCVLGSEPDTHATAAHEGFHQYVARHFRTRIPPAIEEGLACTFENVAIDARGQVTFDTGHNPRRANALARAATSDAWIPIDTLIHLHGGDLAGRPFDLVETYYAQCWALARWLRDDPELGHPFAELLRAVQSGRTVHDIGRTDAPGGEYNPRAIRPLLQRYVAPDWATFVAAAQAAAKGAAAEATR